MFDHAHCERRMTHALARMGFEDTSGSLMGGNIARAVVARTYETDRDRFTAWLYESLLTATRAIERGEPRMALRCTLQAADYCGRLGGFWPGPDASDVYSSLRNALEDALGGLR